MEIRLFPRRQPAPLVHTPARRARFVFVPFGRAIVLLAVTFACAVAGAPVRANEVVVVRVAGAIGPASADFITRGLARAARERAELVVLELDTPGGLDTSMRQIIKAILASPVPVAAYVGPSGARAASAGTYIVYASHIAAMAPGTNLGAATPIEMGVGGSPASPPQPAAARPKGLSDAAAEGASPASTPPPSDTQSTEARKRIADAVAYIRGLAQMRGRNADWAERAVRYAVSLPARDAVEQHVVDFIANDLQDLLAKTNGRTV